MTKDTFKFKLTTRIEKLRYMPFTWPWDLPDCLHEILCQQSRLVHTTPNAFVDPMLNLRKTVFEYELTNQQQLMLDLAGARTYDLWHSLYSITLYINRRINEQHR